jgi:myo-inositol-1(or 4)-monophosphatase
MSNFKDVALTAAHKAGTYALGFADKEVAYSMKNKHDIQAEADLGAEKIIISIIKDAFPGHGIFAEESGEEDINSDYLWIIDPIDGTINFSRHIEEYCVSIALQHKDKIILGVIYQPALNKTIVAEAGKGAYVNGRKMSVSKTEKMIDCVVATDNSSNIPGRIANLGTLTELSPLVRHVRLFGSAALAMGRIAQGQIDIYYKSSFNYWDYAAGIVIVTEAGGIVTDSKGQPISRHSPNVVATNARMHKEALATINKIGKLKINF